MTHFNLADLSALDKAAQTEAVAATREALANALDDLASAALDASRILRRGKRLPATETRNDALDDVHATHRVITRAEEALDLASEATETKD